MSGNCTEFGYAFSQGLGPRNASVLEHCIALLNHITHFSPSQFCFLFALNHTHRTPLGHIHRRCEAFRRLPDSDGVCPFVVSTEGKAAFLGSLATPDTERSAFTERPELDSRTIGRRRTFNKLLLQFLECGITNISTHRPRSRPSLLRRKRTQNASLHSSNGVTASVFVGMYVCVPQATQSTVIERSDKLR